MSEAPTGDPIEIYLSLDEAQNPDAMRALAAKKLAVPLDDLPELRVLRRAIDARGKHTRFHVLLGVGPDVPDEPVGAASSTRSSISRARGDRGIGPGGPVLRI